MADTGKSELDKSPNILILCENDAQRSEIRAVLKTVVSSERYIIYDIRWDELSAGGWSKYTALLVLAGKIPDEKGASALLQFLGDGGKLMSWCCDNLPFGPPESATCTGSSKKTIKYGPELQEVSNVTISDHLWPSAGGQEHPPPAIMEAVNSEGQTIQLSASVYGRVKDTDMTCMLQLDGGAAKGKAILTQIHFEKCADDKDVLALLSLLLIKNLGIDCTQVDAPEYTNGYLLGDEKRVLDFIKSTPTTVQQTKLTVEFIPIGGQGSVASQDLFLVRSLEQPKNFSGDEYFSNLTTNELGRLFIYTDVMASTMNVVNYNLLSHGLVVNAARQTLGRGRGKNIWLSPEGCACFTLQLSLDKDSGMGRRITLLQHIAGLAVVLSMPNHKELGLRVKWPNDIYINDTKIGGILVESQQSGNKFTVNVGIGVNVSNAFPTISLNSVLQEKGCDSTSIGKVIAKTVSEYEHLLKLLDEDSVEKVISLYMDNWVHGSVNDDSKDNVVSVEVTKGNFAPCKITGIDGFGYLLVKEQESGRETSVRPDGNSFDIANKLISMKL